MKESAVLWVGIFSKNGTSGPSICYEGKKTPSLLETGGTFIYNKSGASEPARIITRAPLEKFEMLSTIARYSLRSLLLFSCLAVAEIAFCQQDDVLSRIYGKGVHAYFRGDYQQAHKRLTTAIESGNRDPRAYYFRGLTYQKLGRPEQAKQDFAKAADIEVKDGDLADPVSRALMRIQGPTRLELENYRTEARRKINKRHGEMDEDRFTPRGKERQSPEPVLEPEEEASDDNEDATSSSEEEADDASQKGEGTDEPEKPKNEPEDPFKEDETDEPEKSEDNSEDNPFG